MKKQPLIILVSFFTAAILATGAFAMKCLIVKNVAKAEMQTDFTASLSAITDGLEELSISLNKARNAVTDGFFITSLCEATAAAKGIINALDILPENNSCSLTVTATLAKISDFSDSLIKKAANGREITKEEIATLNGIAASVGTLTESFNNLKGSIDDGSTDLSELFAFSEMSFCDGAVPYSDAVSAWEKLLSEFPTLNYDGKYSDHLNDAEMLFLKDKEAIDSGDLHSMAAELFCLSCDELSDPVTRSGEENLCYLQDGVFAEFSKSGYLVSYISAGKKGENTVSVSEAEKTATDFVKKYGYENMALSLSYTENGVAVFELICQNGDVYCYGDCIKIGVSLSTGEVLTFFASDYLKNHDGAEIEFAHTEEEAAALLADFDIISSRKAVITSAGGTKIPCYEFRVNAKATAYGNGEHELLIYINATDLTEEEMAIIYQTENGTVMIK